MIGDEHQAQTEVEKPSPIDRATFLREDRVALYEALNDLEELADGLNNIKWARRCRRDDDDDVAILVSDAMESIRDAKSNLETARQKVSLEEGEIERVILQVMGE